MEIKNIKVFKEGTEVIKVGDVDKNANIVIIPHSVKEIEDGAFNDVDHAPYTFIYVGTTSEFDNIDTHGKKCAPCINCVDGLKILAL